MKIYNHHAILIDETYKNFNYKICLIDAGWFTCYIDVSESPIDFIEYNSIDLNVWYGLTYSDFHYPWENTDNIDKWIIGWDYAHFEDFYETELVKIIFGKTLNSTYGGNLRHTIPELIRSCEQAIEEIIDKGEELLI